jgi:hypothetical protein
MTSLGIRSTLATGVLLLVGQSGIGPLNTDPEIEESGPSERLEPLEPFARPVPTGERLGHTKVLEHSHERQVIEE